MTARVDTTSHVRGDERRRPMNGSEMVGRDLVEPRSTDEQGGRLRVCRRRLITSQFVQVVSNPATNRGIFKGFVCDESGPFVDRFVARAVQKVRSNNAGMLLLAQSITDYQPSVLQTLLGSVGCRAVFNGVSADDADMFARMWGTEQREDVTNSVSYSTSRSETSTVGGSTTHVPGWPDDPTSETSSWSTGETVSTGISVGRSTRNVETDIWSPGEIVNAIPVWHCIVSVWHRTVTAHHRFLSTPVSDSDRRRRPRRGHVSERQVDPVSANPRTRRSTSTTGRLTFGRFQYRPAGE
jgi:hypothetical protein